MNKSKPALEEGVLQRAVEYIKPVVFVLALCATVLAFSLPIIFYYLTSYSVINNHQATVSLLPNTSNVSNSTIPCDSSTILSWGVIEDSVTECEPYTGTTCLPYLIQWNQCILPGGGDQEEIHVAVNSNGKTQDILEEELSQLNALLLMNFSDCHPSSSIVIPFLCHHYFPLMAAECQSTTVDDDQPLYTVTQEDCINIRDTICAMQLADTLDYTDVLPDCQLLPNTNVSIEEMNMTRSLIPISVSCRYDFILINNTCYPRCDRFEMQSHESTHAMIVAEVLGAALGCLISGITFILAIYNRKRMFTFPSFFLLLFVCDGFVVSVLMLINAVSRTKLNCSSINLLETLENPTMFCYIAGAIVHYSTLNLIIWWFFHLCVFFYEVMFPFHAHRMRELGRLKKLFILLLVLGFLIPVPGVIVGLTSGKLHYNLVRFPPSVCVPGGELWFYSTGFPLTVLLCIGTCLLIIMMWKINRQKTNAKRLKKHQAKKSFTIAEKKLMSISVLFIIFGSYLMIHFGIATGNADRASEGFTSYILCESTGHVPGKCDRKDIERNIYPELNVLTYILNGILPPLFILNFVVNWETLWKSMKRSIRRNHNR